MKDFAPAGRRGQFLCAKGMLLAVNNVIIPVEIHPIFCYNGNTTEKKERLPCQNILLFVI